MSRSSLCCIAALLLFATVAFLYFTVGQTSAGAEASALSYNASQAACFNPAAKIQLTGKSCGPVSDLQLSCYLPADMVSPTPTPPLNFNTLQRAADIFSWQEFIALNWPADAVRRGQPAATKKINDPGPRVWETWKEEYEVYLKDGAPPPAWNDRQPIPGACETGATKLFFREQKIHDVVDSTLQAAAAVASPPPTLTDQKGKVVRYEIRLNKVLFDYIVANQLYNANTQMKLTKPVDFPNGSILIKAAWREVTPAEESLFHTVTACVCDKDSDGNIINCHTERMGLVGFHITAKTAFAPQWVWSTFEHLYNVPGSVVTNWYSFYNPSCNATNCPPNQQTNRGFPTQIIRSISIPNVEPDCTAPTEAVDNVWRLNNDVKKALSTAGSVFQNYQLVNTQWPVPGNGSQPETVFKVRPVALGNTTMESFVQPTSTCMGCHSTARTVNPNQFLSSDFSFTLNNAQPAQTNCKVIPPPTQPQTQWDKDNWVAITRGYVLANETYERLPTFVPTAKLHCASCHLNVGGNSDAAWWANVVNEYQPVEKLQARINQCFTNSLNGKPLCVPGAGCANNVYMEGFVTYMQWLNYQRLSMKLCNTVPDGFPPISGTGGKATRGSDIFVQKCAVCHRLDGQGRYQNGYFRPALWGPQSFNQSAGMFANPQDLAQFVRWNMPLMAGGELTDQEAWDVEAYIHSKPRPSPTSPRKRY